MGGRSALAVVAWLSAACESAVPEKPAPPPPPPPRLPASAEATLEAVIDGCRQANASLIWPVLSSSLKHRLDARALEERERGRDYLSQRYGYAEHEGGFDGSALLEGALHRPGELHPCPNADLWRRADVQVVGDRALASYLHPDGRTQMLALEQVAEHWFLDEFAADPSSMAGAVPDTSQPHRLPKKP